MNVSEAVERRVSIRVFKPDPIPGTVVREILERAARSPSGGNFQPWRVFALTGAPLAEFKAIIAAKRRDGIKEKPEYAVYPPNLWEPFYGRRGATRLERYAALGLDPNDKSGDAELSRRNFEFFGAPVGLFLCYDRRLGSPQWSDLGMYLQTVMLLATERGIDTCPQEAWSQWPQSIREFLNLPEHETIFSGMSMGYRDPTHPLNAIRTPRVPFEGFATMRGFD